MKKPTFEDLAALSRNDLKTVRRQVETETVQRALCILPGDSGEVFDAFRLTMGEVNWRRLMDEIDALGHVPEADVLAARLEIVDFALALVESGDILKPERTGEGEGGDEFADGDDLAAEWEQAEAAGKVTTFDGGVRVRFFGAEGNDQEPDEEDDKEDDFATKWEKAKAAGTATTFADVIKTSFFAADGNEEENDEEDDDDEGFVLGVWEDGTEFSDKEILASVRRILEREPEEEDEEEDEEDDDGEGYLVAVRGNTMEVSMEEILAAARRLAESTEEPEAGEERDEEEQKDLAQQWDEMVAAGPDESAEEPGDGDGKDAPRPATWEDILTEDVLKDMFNRDADAHGWPEGPERDALEVQFREIIDLIKSSTPPPRVTRYTQWVRDSDDPEDLIIRESPPANDDEDGEGDDKE